MRASATLAVLLALALPATAGAQALTTARVDGGQTRIRSSTLQVTGGYVDPRTGIGRIEHRGTLRLRGRRDVRNPVIRTTSLRPRRVRSNELVTHVAGISRRFGIVRLRLELAHLVVAGGTTTLALDPAFADTLRRLGIGVGGETAYPIAGGRLDAGSLAGELGHTGGLSLTRGDTLVTVIDPAVVFGPASVFSAALGDVRRDVATLDRTGSRRTLDGRALTVEGLVARLTPLVAGGLNTRFETDAFREGTTLGTLTVRGRLRG